MCNGHDATLTATPSRKSPVLPFKPVADVLYSLCNDIVMQRFDSLVLRITPSSRVAGLVPALAVVLFFAMTSPAGSVVTVNSDMALVLNGRKVFPIGFSPGPPTYGVTPTGKDAMQEFRDAGALLFRIVQTNNWNSQLIADQQAALDWAAQHDMYCWLNLRELSKFAAGDTTTEASLRNIVNTFKNHPALGLWKNFDEAWWGGVSADDLKRGYDVIHQEDTNHPIVQTHAPRGTVADLSPYNVATDVLALDIYPVTASGSASNPPITNTAVSQVGDWTKVLGQVANGQKQYWLIEQIAFSGTTPPAKTLVFPTFTQSRYMAYQAIINGARGLMFFGGNIAATLNAQDAPLGWNWTFWTNVLKPVVEELGDHSLLADALVAPASVVPVTMSGTVSPDIEFCLREAPPYLYLLASKREGATTNVTFGGLPPTVTGGDVLYESPRTVTVAGGQFTDSFAQWDVHVYRFLYTNQPPVILIQPVSRTNDLGTPATFSVTAYGSSPLTYQWRKNGSNLVNTGNVSGATSATLTLSNVAQSDMADYTVVVSGVGSVTSAPPAALVVNTNVTPPAITSQPQSGTHLAGATVNFSVTATGTPPLAYQWRRNGTNLANVGNVSGASSSMLSLSNISQGDAAGYDVVVTGAGSVTSAPLATLTVVPKPANLILYEPFDYPNLGGPVSSNTPSNWAYGGSGANDLSVVSGNLFYVGLATSLGSSVTNGGTGLGVRRLFGTNLNSGKIWYSALFRINDLGYGAWNGGETPIGMLSPTDNTTFCHRVMVKSNSPAGCVIGVQKGGTGATSTFSPSEHYAGETIFVVGKYDYTVLPNVATLWINPNPSLFGAAVEPGTGFVSASTGTNGMTIDRFNIRQNTTTSVPAAMQWDELRIGRSWADVTPVAPLTPVSLISPTRLTSGAFQFLYANFSTQTFTVYFSSNLNSWSALSPAMEVSPGQFQFTDYAASNSLRRFYRLRSP